MNDINNLFLIGRLVADPVISTTTTGQSVCKFTLAVNEKYGEKEHVNFFDCVVWAKSAEILMQYGNKGKRLAISGRLRQERWESDGKKNSRIVINVEHFQFLDKKESDTTSPKIEENFSNPFNDDGIPF